MTKNRAALGAVATISLALGAPAAMGQIVNNITGNFSDSTNGCSVPILLFVGNNCTYNASDYAPPLSSGAPWTGPAFSGSFYLPGTSPGVNTLGTPGDGKAGLAITGTVTITDPDGTYCNGDETIEMAAQMEAGVRNFQGGQTGIGEETFDSIDLAVPPSAVTSATPGAGDCTLLVASNGFPAKIVSGTDEFPTENEIDPVLGGTPWGGPEPSGIGIFSNSDDGVNVASVGTSMTITPNNYACTDNGLDGTPACQSSLNLTETWNAAENVLIQLVTDTSGVISQGDMYITNEYSISGLNVGIDPSSFDAATATFASSGPGGPSAGDVTGNVLTSGTVDIPINATDFTDPVTVTIGAMMPTLGTAMVTGSPGAAAGISINYMAGATAGTDTFEYTVTDGVATDSGTVTVTVEADSIPVAPDGSAAATEADTRGVAAGDIAVALDVATLPGFDPGNDSTITTANDMGGSSSVAGTVITFTPDASPGTGSYEYTITESAAGGSGTATGTVTIDVPDVQPSVTQDSTGAVAAGDSSTTVDVLGDIVPGNGSPAEHTFAVSSQPANGNASFSGSVATYTPNADFASSGGGEDCFGYDISDADGDAASGQICVNVEGTGAAVGLPGGGSAMDLWTLSLLLGTAPLLARRRRAD